MHDNARRLKFYGYLALVVLLGISIALLRPSPVLSDPDLTAAVNAAFVPRTETPELHDLAHRRALEISTDFSHAGATTAEVIAHNATGSLRAVDQWLNSPDHYRLLSDASYNLIGCAAHFDGTWWVVCVLARGTAPALEPTDAGTVAPPAPVGHEPTPTPVLIPDTAIHSGEGG